jgi:hypothetical protein
MASTTFIDNQTTIFADWLNDANNAVYNGVFVSPTITATSMVCTGTASGAGFTNLINNVFSAPSAIGTATPNTGAFTTLSATTLTGLSAVGNSGNVLTSNGTNWVPSASQSIGIGQTWQIVTRVSGTTYTNTTGRPLQFFVTSTVATTLSMVIDGVTFPGVGFNSGNNPTAYYIIPPGSTYTFTLTGTITAIELR